MKLRSRLHAQQSIDFQFKFQQREGNGGRKRKKTEQQLYPMYPLSKWTVTSTVTITGHNVNRNQFSALAISQQSLLDQRQSIKMRFLLMFLSVSESPFLLPWEIFKFCPAFSTGPSSLCFRKPLMPMIFPNKSGQSCTPPQKRWSGEPSDLRVTYFLLHTTVKIPAT